ncbi:MAG: Hsp20/alpha crystallin family protein [Candidatus Helarchaeota archaeon]
MADDYDKGKKKKRKKDDDREDDYPTDSLDNFIDYLADNLKNIMPDLEEFFTQLQDKINNGSFKLEDLNEFNSFKFGKVLIPQNTKAATISKNPPQKDPIVDIMDCGDRMIIIADLPGLEKKDIKLNLKKNSVLISVHKKKIHKRISLSCEIDKNSISAKYKNGILEITLNKV